MLQRMSSLSLPRTKIIAEFTSNHLGDPRIITSMLEESKRIGVDVVKFQSWQAKQLRSDFPDYDATFARHQSAELSDADHERIVKECHEMDLEFLTTCFDIARAEFLASLDIKMIKVASPDATSFKMIDKLCDLFETVIISTGLIEHEELTKLLDHLDPKKVVVLHCISLYPTPLDEANLSRMLWIREQGFRMGFSDHTACATAPKLACALGAEYIEKHFTLSNALPGKDQLMSSTPDIFKEICDWRDQVQLMMGKPERNLTDTEKGIRDVYVGKWGDNS